VCGIPSQGTNKLMAELVRLTSDERCLENLQARLTSLQGARRFPDDGEFRRSLQERDLYSLKTRSYLLRRLENSGRKERVTIEEYTIEHIMPQNENLNRAWRRELGDNYKEVHGKYLHTLGNLTLTGYNSEYSDRSFAEKRDMHGGFRESPLSLNKGLGTLSVWNEAEIVARAKRLSEIAVKVWPLPVVDSSVAEVRRAIKSRRAEYSLNDHRHLKDSAMRSLFNELRKEVMALDPSVTEEVLKMYIAFKYDTNFVDVVPQAKRLRLELNMPFHEIRDPRGMCEDVSGKGHWGNGDVEVSLTSLDDLPYVLGLVRQSFERQLGSEV
jgi:predicted transport protein